MFCRGNNLFGDDNCLWLIIIIAIILIWSCCGNDSCCNMCGNIGGSNTNNCGCGC